MLRLRRIFLKQRRAVTKLQAFANAKRGRLLFLKWRRSAVKIQSLVKMRMAMKSFKVMKQKAAEAKRDRMIEMRKRALEMKKVKKAMALKIEAARYRQLHRRECRELRKYLAKLPYECRGLYFKFILLKKQSHLLVNDFVGFMEQAHRIQVEGADGPDLKYVY